MFWKSKKKKESENAIPDCFARTYSVELFYEDLPNFDQDKLLSSIRERCGDVDLFARTGAMLGFAFKEHTIEYKDGSAPPQIAIMIANKVPDLDKLEPSFYQSWDFKDARKSVAKCEHTVLVTDLMASSLDYKTRIEIFQKTLYSIMEQAPCAAMYWLHSQRIVEPAQYVLNKPENEDYNLLYGPLNVRLFNIEETKNDTLMDTFGLGALGLPDLQCHFKNLDVNAVASHLYTYGDYIFLKGDVIEDGNTIQGIANDQKWACQHEVSLTEPKRVVLDINPGIPFAAGNR
jgi:ligand-binding SRPBCC domain-containing protein